LVLAFHVRLIWPAFTGCNGTNVKEKMKKRRAKGTKRRGILGLKNCNEPILQIIVRPPLKYEANIQPEAVFAWQPCCRILIQVSGP
jgi:hypothetical protein